MDQQRVRAAAVKLTALTTIRRPSREAVTMASTVPGCQRSGFICEMSLKKVARLSMSRKVPEVDAR
jgi:hypothetical protein